jgi:hypothetical protein
VARRREAAAEEGVVSRVGRLAVLVIGLCVAAGAAQAQSNLDAGKSAAQIFSDTCSACHRSPRELRRTSPNFMREHYTSSAQEAGVMAAYLATIGSDPRAVQSRRTPALGAGQAAPKETAARPATATESRPPQAVPADNALRPPLAIPNAPEEANPAQSAPAMPATAAARHPAAEEAKPAVAEPKPPIAVSTPVARVRRPADSMDTMAAQENGAEPASPPPAAAAPSVPQNSAEAFEE